jgi:phenylalanyl-tRNA synthetase beta subunit
MAFQSDSRTLSDEDGARLRQAVVAALGDAFQAALRA